MIASKDSIEPKSSDYVMPNSQRVYVEGEIHPEVRVPFREISLAPTKDFDGQLEPNEPVRVYDTSGPWGDAQFAGGSSQGIPALREKWIRGRGDVAVGTVARRAAADGDLRRGGEIGRASCRERVYACV